MAHATPHPTDAPSAAAASCNNCGSSNAVERFAAGRAQRHRIVQCRDCGLMYAHPLLDSNLSHYLVAPEARAPLDDDSPEVRRGRDKLPDYLDVERVLSQLLPGRGLAVEVGAYSGLLLEHFRRAGWRVQGIEPDGRGVAYARRRFGIDVHHGTLDTAPIAAGSVDAVVMLHVIEHIDDPSAAVRAVARLLRTDGVFAVETPTYDSLAFRLLGRRERSLSCDGHIYFYDETTLTRLLTASGFDVVRVERVGRTMTLARLLWNVGVMAKNARVRAGLERLSRRWRLADKRLYINARDMIRIYARKRAR